MDGHRVLGCNRAFKEPSSQHAAFRSKVDYATFSFHVIIFCGFKSVIEPDSIEVAYCELGHKVTITEGISNFGG